MASVRSLNCEQSDRFVAWHGDCVDVLRQLPDRCIDFSVFSPPFSGLYIYGDSRCDMGNSCSHEEFFEHYRFFVAELFRTLRPGRLVAVHCKDLVYYRTQKTTAGLYDFPGALVRAHVEAGFDFHSRTTIWRSPVREMTKTKAHGLLYKQLRADSTFSRQGLPEYLLWFRRWAREGEEIRPVTHTHASFPLSQWQEWASPVWMETRETDVLHDYRAPDDEKHICPLPLDLITRCVILGSNQDEAVLSPFMGIGSEGHVALREGRRFVGIELKREYWEQSVRNLREAERCAPTMFAVA